MKYLTLVALTFFSISAGAQLKTEDMQGQLPEALANPALQKALIEYKSKMSDEQYRIMLEQLKTVQQNMNQQNQMMNDFFAEEDRLYRSKQNTGY